MPNMVDMMSKLGNLGGPEMQAAAAKVMANPAAQQLIAKAQKNPRVLAAVTECMGNPAAFIKYKDDPEIKEILDELRTMMK